jgi:vacuolar-type H+-ATPase subunit I/STV1
MDWFVQALQHLPQHPMSIMAMALLVGLAALVALQKSGVLARVTGEDSGNIIIQVVDKGFWLLLVAIVLAYLQASGNHLFSVNKDGGISALMMAQPKPENITTNELNASAIAPGAKGGHTVTGNGNTTGDGNTVITVPSSQR